MSENLDLHDDSVSVMIRYRGLDRDFISVLVFGFGHIEYREGRRGETDDDSIGKLTSRTLSPASIKRY
jgi:hypothetical protein